MDEDRVRILLIEDDPDDVWIMRSLLGDRWDGPFELVHVETLADAATCLAGGDFDVVLLDLTLPDSRGWETFLRVQACAGQIPIVMLTGFDDRRIAVRALQAGAQDYLVKGQLDDDLLVRSIRYAIERSRRHYAEQQLLANSEEFRVAQQIQRRLFPSEAPKTPGFDIAGALYPAKATAGDYFDYVPMLADCVGIVLGDVSGHGMGPALLMAETRACLRVLAETYPDVGEILTRTNHVLTADIADFHFITLMMARLDPRARTLVYASAGQRGYLMDSSGRIRVLDSTSPPLGINQAWRVETSPEIALQTGQILAMFTDGLTEAESPGRLRFGTEAALDVILGSRKKLAAGIVEDLRHAITDFCRHQTPEDDITIVVVKVDESPAS